jgi:PAB-dependent poly(A)-specific ribonuclease subunit 2
VDRHDDMKDLRCMSFTSKGSSEILAAGMQDIMFVIDLAKGQVIKQVRNQSMNQPLLFVADRLQVPTNHHYVLMKRSRYICAATQGGTVNLLDPVSLAVLKTWNAHSAGISDMDAQHDFIVTCGYSLRQGQNYMLDPFLNVYDIKKMTSMPPIPFPAGAAHVRMHPRMSTTSIVMSQTGQMHVVDLMNPNTSNVRQANITTYLTMFDIAPSGEAIAMADAGHTIHLWASPSKVHFVDFPTPCEFATPQEHLPQIEWNSETLVSTASQFCPPADHCSPLNSIGMPYYREVLASAWPEIISDVGAPPVKFDPQFLKSLKPTDFGLFGPNTRGLHRNQVEDTRHMDGAGNFGLKAPKFLSEKARESAKTSAGGGSSHLENVDEISNTLAVLEVDSSKAVVPLMYRNVEMKYSKFGVDDFDFQLVWIPKLPMDCHSPCSDTITEPLTLA